MSWQIQDVVRPGQYVWCKAISGIWLDPFGSIEPEHILQRVKDTANGWTPISIDLNSGLLFSLGGHTYIFGRANREIPAMEVAAQVKQACDSFIEIAATEFSVTASDSLDEPLPNSTDRWANTLQWVAVAAIAVAIVYGIRQIKEISD